VFGEKHFVLNLAALSGVSLHTDQRTGLQYGLVATAHGVYMRTCVWCVVCVCLCVCVCVCVCVCPVCGVCVCVCVVCVCVCVCVRAVYIYIYIYL
jgi:hypothetical protein